MASSKLNTYLNDHLSGATTAIEIIRHLSEQSDDRELARFALDLKTKVDDDRKILLRLIDQTGVGRSWFKVLLAWYAGIFSKLKLGPGMAGKLGAFEALEILSIGILGKRALWRVLQQLQQNGGSALSDIRFGDLATQADSQFEAVEAWRMTYARRALGSA